MNTEADKCWTQGMIDRYGRVLPDEQHTTPDFKKRIPLRAGTEAVAHHLTHFLVV